MGAEGLDISDSLDWEDGLPRPRWDLLDAWVDTRAGPGGKFAAWSEIGRQWLARLGPALGGNYLRAESEHFLLLAPDPGPPPAALLSFAEKCRQSLLSILCGVTEFGLPGKKVVLALRDRDDYYRYISAYYPEGEHGGSAGVHVREGRPHIALCGNKIDVLENSLAHEMTHASLSHLAHPPWVEEGLAQMFEHDMTGRSLQEVDGEMARRHKRYWGKHGLDDFWRGEGFSRPGKVQELSYQLAEILVRLMVEEHRPGWFGLARERQGRFFRFLREAKASDCGESAAREYLGFGLSELASRFLGDGRWAPSL